MGLLSNKIDREKLNPGDHIYSWRAAFTYAHHGIYVGEGKVIHFTQEDAIVSSSFPAQPCPQCGYNSRSKGVVLSCIDCFLSGDELHRYEYGVSPVYFLAKVRGGTCTLATSDPPADVLHRANVLLENGFGDFRTFKNNCEDFAIYCKTGLIRRTTVGTGGQAASIHAAVASGVVAVFTGGLAAVCYCGIRLASDIGVRPDVEKVPVETLVARCRR